MSESSRPLPARPVAIALWAILASACASNGDSERNFAVGGPDASTGGASGAAGAAGGGGTGASGSSGSAGSGGGFPSDLGEPCEQNTDCIAAICVEGPDGTVCSGPCAVECPPDYECLPYEAPGIPAGQVCMPSLARQCRPCTTDSDCHRDGVTADPSRCVSSGDDGSFCSVACPDDACPDTYTCENAAIGAGQTEKLCVPSNDRACACRDAWAGKGYQTSCAESNTHGSCQGTRACEAAGLSACSAATPSAEVCDGADNDCNAAIDDGTCNDGLGCTDDACDGAGACEHSIQSGMCLIAGACLASGDINPAHPCELCAPQQSQTNWSVNTGSCNDGDACTNGDTCTDGTCSGSPVQDTYEPNDTSSAPAPLPSASDCDTFPTGTIGGTLYGPGDEDWYRYHDSDNFLCSIYPRVRLTVPAGANHDLCVYVTCDDLSSPSVSCPSGTYSTGYGMKGCCSQNGGAAQDNVRMDHDCNATDDSGYVYVRVFNAGTYTCDAYQLEYGDD